MARGIERQFPEAPGCRKTRMPTRTRHADDLRQDLQVPAEVVFDRAPIARSRAQKGSVLERQVVRWPVYLTASSFALDRLLVGDGGHPFDVEQLAAAWLKVKDGTVSVEQRCCSNAYGTRPHPGNPPAHRWHYRRTQRCCSHSRPSSQHTSGSNEETRYRASSCRVRHQVWWRDPQVLEAEFD